MANIKYRSLKIKFIKMGKNNQYYYYLWLFKNNKKFRLIGRYFPHHFRIDNQFIRVCIVDTIFLARCIKQGVVFKSKIAKLLQGFLL